MDKNHLLDRTHSHTIKLKGDQPSSVGIYRVAFVNRNDNIVDYVLQGHGNKEIILNKKKKILPKAGIVVRLNKPVYDGNKLTI